MKLKTHEGISPEDQKLIDEIDEVLKNEDLDLTRVKKLTAAKLVLLGVTGVLAARICQFGYASTARAYHTVLTSGVAAILKHRPSPKAGYKVVFTEDVNDRIREAIAKGAITDSKSGSEWAKTNGINVTKAHLRRTMFRLGLKRPLIGPTSRDVAIGMAFRARVNAWLEAIDYKPVRNSRARSRRAFKVMIIDYARAVCGLYDSLPEIDGKRALHTVEIQRFLIARFKVTPAVATRLVHTLTKHGHLNRVGWGWYEPAPRVQSAPPTQAQPEEATIAPAQPEAAPTEENLLPF
jgi:hypothetical protein